MINLNDELTEAVASDISNIKLNIQVNKFELRVRLSTKLLRPLTTSISILESDCSLIRQIFYHS